jgi:hypothetical protein
MFPHSDTICSLGELDYQELLRTAAQQRLAATFKAGPRPQDPMPGPAHRTAVPWISRPLRSAQHLLQAWLMAGRPSGSAPSAHPVA